MFNIFCDVIDNYGDAGVCLRLCRDLTKKNFHVNFFCNDLIALQKILSFQDIDNSLLSIKDWPNEENYESSTVVIQAFSVRLPKFLYTKFKEDKSLVINLEYLTAEPFAEYCHKLASYSDNIECFFFFPGFTNKTGGVVIEDFIKNLKKNENNNVDSITLFSYENPEVKFIFSLLNDLNKHFKIHVFEGKPLDNFNLQTSNHLKVGKSLQIDNLTFIGEKMVSQNKYDEFLSSSFINMVRGEDSIVRAMIIGRPFLWHIYPQDEDAHKGKINALFDVMKLYCSDKDAVENLRSLTLKYNGFEQNISDFNFNEFIEKWIKISKEWSDHILSLGSLTDNLLSFVNQKICINHEKTR